MNHTKEGDGVNTEEGNGASEEIIAQVLEHLGDEILPFHLKTTDDKYNFLIELAMIRALELQQKEHDEKIKFQDETWKQICDLKDFNRDEKLAQQQKEHDKIHNDRAVRPTGKGRSTEHKRQAPSASATEGMESSEGKAYPQIIKELKEKLAQKDKQVIKCNVCEKNDAMTHECYSCYMKGCDKEIAKVHKQVIDAIDKKIKLWRAAYGSEGDVIQKDAIEDFEELKKELFLTPSSSNGSDVEKLDEMPDYETAEEPADTCKNCHNRDLSNTTLKCLHCGNEDVK